jgi:2-polyprenyl-3-methyl-5-hydroxy-6-metoxy-1,4-benzoquinol methylase
MVNLPEVGVALQGAQHKSDMAEVPCPLCGSADHRLYVMAPSHYGPERYAVTRCQRCGMIFTNPQQSSYTSEVEERGVLDRHLRAETLSVGCRQARLQLRLLERFTGGRRVFDFGCGAGMFVHEAIVRGWEAVGHDLNRGLVAAANRHWGFDALHTGPLEEFITQRPGPYDALLSNQVFEHLQRPLEVGEHLVRLLKPGGLLYLDVPNVRQPREWFQRGVTLDPTSHWCHFSSTTLPALVEKLGCEPIFVSAAPALLGLWHKVRLGEGDAVSALGALCKRWLPPVGTGVCVIGRKRA